ncbi:MAG: flavodoxin family protein [Vicinamibacteria bacterium]
MRSSWILAASLFAAVPESSSRAPELVERAILVAFDSRTGHTERLARAVADGAASVEGARVVVKPESEVREEEILGASGILLGSPVHWASQSAKAKLFLERIGDALVRAKELGPESTPRNRTAGAFVTGGAPSSGKELARLAILAAFLNMRFIVVGGEESDGFGTLGAQATTAGGDPGVSEEELEEARRFGRRFATVTLALVQ